MHHSEPPDSVDTLLVHFGEEEKLKGAVVPPIFQNSLFVFEHAQDLLSALGNNPEGPPYSYSKVGNPTVEIVEKKLAAMEGLDACKVTGGGIGAISIALSSELEAGAHAVIIDTAYGPARSYIKFMERFGVTHTMVDGMSVDGIIDAVRPETRLIYLESPSSIMFRMQDIDAVTKIAREKKITTFFDNTYNTPIHMRPAEHGIDIVCHSASKYLGGHSDLNAGAVCTDRKRMDRIVRNELSYYSNMIHPISGWLMLRGMRTLRLRLKQHELCANLLASWLEGRPEVDVVHHVSLPNFPQRELYLSLMSGSGGLFSFEPKVQDQEKVMAFCDALRLFARGISWGGHESLVVPVQMNERGERRWVIRLFCGLEDPEDLRKDVEQGLKALQ